MISYYNVWLTDAKWDILKKKLPFSKKKWLANEYSIAKVSIEGW